MYLFVFVLLLASLLGMYTEIFAVQNAKMLSKQKGIAEIMYTWHNGAVGFAKKHIADGDLGGGADAAGCLITDNASPFFALPSSPSVCAQKLNYTDADFLPSGYDATYKWYSIVYTSGSKYVITFARPPVTGAGGGAGTAVDSMEQPNIDFSVSDVWRHMMNMHLTTRNYGMVRTPSGGGTPELWTPDNSTHYPLPSCGSACIPDGSVGFISSL